MKIFFVSIQRLLFQWQQYYPMFFELYALDLHIESEPNQAFYASFSFQL